MSPACLYFVSAHTFLHTRLLYMHTHAPTCTYTPSEHTHARLLPTRPPVHAHAHTQVSVISRESIDALKEYFKDEMTKDDWRVVIKLKKTFNVT